MERKMKAILGERQLGRLSAAQRKFNQLFLSTIKRLLLSMLRRVPDTMLITIKSNAEIIKRMDYQGSEILLAVDSHIEYNTRLHSCKKEPETIEWIERFFKKNDVFYDVGANVGAYSLVAAKFFKGNIKVYAFEPAFTTFPELCKNILINKCHESIIPLQIGLSDTTTIDVFNYNNLIPGGALHALGEPIDYKGDIFAPVFKQPMLSYRIDDLVNQFNIPLPNHMKIDIDGNEFKVLKGAEKTLDSPLVKSVLLEVEEGGKDVSRITEFLACKGIKFHSKHGDAGPSPKTHNYIFQRDI